MYIVAIAWIYVVLLMAATETSLVAGLMTFVFYCVIPLSVLLYLMVAQKRKSRLKKNQFSTPAAATNAAVAPAAPPITDSSSPAAAPDTAAADQS